MSRPGLPSSPYTPVFGIPSVAGIKPPKMAAMPSMRRSTGMSGGTSLEEALGYISNLSKDLQPEQEDTTPFIAFSPSNKQMFVNGFTFDENDATRALESEQYLGQSAQRPETGDWQRIPASVYQDYLQSIRDPSPGTRFAKSFSSGVGSLQQLWGAALMAATDGGAGQDLYEAGGARMERLQPFAKKFSEVKNLDDAGDFMVSLLGSQAPNILESITTALIGAGLGAGIGATGGPVGSAAGGLGGAATGFLAKGVVKDQLKAIANKKLAKQVITPDEDALWKREAGKTGTAIQLAARKKAAGEVLSPDEQKLIRQGAAVTGALTLSTLENYGIGVGDIYGEMLEKGVADEPGARAAAFGYAVPYAALSTAPEFLGALALFRPTKSTGLRAAAGRFGTGLAVGAAGEGVSEASQEGLIMGAAEGFGAQYTPQERGERLLEAGVAGAVLGGITGGPINLLRRPEREAGITPPAAPAAPTAPTAPAAPPEGPTLADIPDIPPPPDPESVLGTPGLRPPPPEAPFPSGEAYEDINPAASYMGGRPEEEEFVGAPPVRPGQEGTFFQEEDLGTIITPAAKPATAEPEVDAVAEGQQPLFTQRGTPAAAAAQGAGFGATNPLKPEQRKSLNWLTKNGGEQFPMQAATNLGSAQGVVIQANDYNVKKMITDGAQSVVKVSFFGRKDPVTVAYDETVYGSPQQFAEAMGFDYAMLDTGTFTRTAADGAVSSKLPITEYAPPVLPITKTEATRRKDIRAKTSGGTPSSTTTPKKDVPRAIQKRKPKKVAPQEQAGDGEGVRTDDATKRKPAGEDKAETTQKEPVREAEADVEEVVATEYPPLARQYSEVFGAFQRVRYMRRGDVYIEQKRTDEVDRGRIQKPGTWKYSSVLLTKEEADAKYAKRKNTDYYKRDVAIDLEKLPEGPPPSRRRLTEEADVAPAAPALPTVVNILRKKDPDGTYTYTVTLSDGRTAKVFKDKYSPIVGWYVDDSKYDNPVQSRPGHVPTYLGDNLKDVEEKLPEIFTRLEALPTFEKKPAPKTLKKAEADVAAVAGVPETAVFKRQQALSPTQKTALLTELGTDVQGMIDILVDDPARLNAAIDRVLMAELAKIKTTELAADVAGMKPAKTINKEAEKQIIMIMELRRRVAAEDAETDPGFDYAVEVIGALDGNTDTKRLHNAAKKRIEEAEAETDPTARASVAPRSLKKNKVKEQTVRGVVDRILSKISPEARKGTEVQYAASMEDLKANNPKLYRLLEKSREKQGDIGTVTPAAFYLRRGDGTATVVMFTDNIVDETHATLVFLEEMVSHHGFRSLLGNEVNPLMEKIYDENPEIAAAAEAYAKENKGVSKAEATEEVIAKELAREIGVELGILSPSAQPSYVPVGILTRLINEIRKLLSKVLGKQTVAFMDSEDVRVLFAKSKQFARTGTKDPLKSHPNFTGTYRGFAQEPRTAAPVVYHGSPNKVEGDLRPSSSAGLFGPGVYLTSDKERARGYAGITGEVVELTVSGKLATRDQWKAATKAASEGVKPSPNAQTEIDNKAIADLEAQGFVGVQAGNIVTVWKSENLQSAVVSRFSVATPEGGPKAAERLTPEERTVLGNTTAADVYERAANGNSNAKIAEDLKLTSEIVKQIYAAARAKLQTAGVTPRARRTSPKKTTKAEKAIVALGTRKADGTYPSVAEVAKEIDAAESTVTTAIKEERQRLADEGKKIPDFLMPPEVQGVSHVFEYAQATTSLYNPQRPVPRDIADALDWLNNRKINVAQLGRDVLNALKTMNFASRSNAGYREGYRVLTDMKNKIAQLRSKYTAMLEDVLMNTDDNVRKEVSAMLQFTTKAKLNGLTDRELNKIKKQHGSLFNVVGNKIVVNPKVFQELSRRGRFTLEEFQQGLKREQDVPLFDKDGNPTTRKETLTFKAMPDLTKTSPSWELYERVRDTMDQAALDRVEADYAAAFGARENAFRTIEYASNKELTQADKDFVLRIDQRYREMAKEGAKPDDTGRLVHKVDSLAGASQMIADFNTALIADAKKKDKVYKERMDTFLKHFPEKEQAEVRQQMERFQDGMTFAESNKYDVQRVVANVAALELGREGTELYAMRSIAGGYIPIGRTGRWQTRIRAVDPDTGQVYGLMESFRTQLPYFQHEDRAAAENLAKDINKLFPTDKATMEIPVFDTKTKKYTTKKVRLEAVADAARETSSVDPGVNINDFQRMVTRFGITLTPEERERVIIGMTEQDARARQGLMRENTEGADPDSIPYISQHLVSLANITGRRTHQHETDRLLDEKDPQSQRLWSGDPLRLKALEERLDALSKDPLANENAIDQLEREFNQLAFEMRRTEEEGGQGVFRDRFVRDLAFLEDQKALEYADFASDGLGQEVRTWTAVAQLGGLISSAALNAMALPLNVLPGLASYNPKTNFGGGFGMAKASAAIMAAGKDVGGMDRYRAEYYKNLLENKEALANSGLTRDEAEFLGREIEFGNLQASLANALLASAKGRFGRNPKVQKFIDRYMSAFTYVEQMASRTAALAAYRLEKERLLDAGIDPDNAQKMAGQFAIDLKNNTIGNYDMYNRPGAFRGGLRDFIFMYKMYPLMVIQLLSSLSLSGKAAMLVPLLIFSGIKGLPGAEDFMDILDTIMQALGMKVGSSEKWLAEQLNEIAPGLTPTIMRGVVDQMVPATVSSRVSMGNLIPGTSMFISGSNQFNEMLDFLGPAASFVEGSVSTAAATAQLGLSTVGLSDRGASVTGIMRGSPVTLMRAVGDSVEYAQVGAIVDSKGYVSSYDLNAGTYVSRLLGFYPAAATRENDVVRVTKREADYLREVSTEFRQSYVKAALRNDREGMQRVVQRVRDWNEASDGTGLEINNFAINARRAVQEARKTSSERYATSAPKSLRRDIEEAQEAFGTE